MGTTHAVRLGPALTPGNTWHPKLYGVSVVAGIGFTVALFIAALAFSDPLEYLDEAKLGILLGSLVAGSVGFLLLRFSAQQEAT